VIYGHGKSVSVAVSAKEFAKAIHTKAGLNALFNVKLGSESTLAIIKDIQRNMFTQLPIHVDIQRINVKEKLEVNVPVHAIGVASGVKNFGGVMEYILREIRVRCLPDDIPASIDVDVTPLNIGQSVRLSDITPPKGVEYVTTADHLLINVVAPKVEEEVKPAEAATAAPGAEPEVITKGKKDEEGAVAAGAAPAKGAAPAAAGAKAAAPAAKEEKKK
jgi:large subunit ribosomal protein L25